MRLFRTIAAVLFFALPASAAETDLARFPFATEPGDYRGLVVYPDARRAMRIVFLAVSVERPSEDRATLQIGGDGRVVIQIAQGEGFATGAVLDFGDNPITLRSGNGRITVEAVPQAISLPTPDGALGTATLTDATVMLSWPTRASSDPQDAVFDLSFAAADFDGPMRAWLARTDPPPFGMGAFDLSGRIGVVLRDDLVDGGEPPRPSRIEIDAARADLFDGRIDASGVADIEGGALASLRGMLRLDDFAGMLERSAAAGVFVPEAVMPFALLAVASAEESTDGTLSLTVETAGDGSLVVNGAPIPLSLRR